jgi:hypothetical protein
MDTRVPSCSRSLLLGRWRTWSWWTPRSPCSRIVGLELVVEVVLMEEMVLCLVVLRRVRLPLTVSRGPCVLITQRTLVSVHATQP